MLFALHIILCCRKEPHQIILTKIPFPLWKALGRKWCHTLSFMLSASSALPRECQVRHHLMQLNGIIDTLWLSVVWYKIKMFQVYCCVMVFKVMTCFRFPKTAFGWSSAPCTTRHLSHCHLESFAYLQRKDWVLQLLQLHQIRRGCYFQSLPQFKHIKRSFQAHGRHDTDDETGQCGVYALILHVAGRQR